MSLYKRFKSDIQKAYNFLTHEQEILYFAASLSFYTIFAIIPLTLVILSVISTFSSFQLQINSLKSIILSYIIPANTQTFINILDTFMRNAQAMGLMGLFYAMVTSFLFFRNYEFITTRMFNTKPRKWLDSLILYWLMVTFFPIMIVGIFYLNTAITHFLASKFQILILGNFFSLVFVCIFFLILFRISANQELNTKILVISSCICASIWYLFKIMFVSYISYNKTYPTLYGSISVLLISMIWIYFSWIILLFGMRVCKGISIIVEESKNITS